jgi:hypothetical protein
MSCLPGSPCYNTTSSSSGDPCNPNGAVSCATVIYNGPNLPTTGIDTCTNLCVALQEIDNTISQIVSGSNITASNGLTKVGDDIRLGGSLTQSTTIATGIYDLILTGIDAGSPTDQLLVLTPGGVVKKVAASSLTPSITLTPNSGLDWTDAPTNTELRTLYNTLVNDNAQSIPLGGAPSHPASYWKTKTFVEMFDEILFPPQLPTYTIPEVQIIGITTQPAEVGSTISINATIRADKWDAGAFTILRMLKTVNGGSPTTSTPSITTTTGAAFGTQFTFADPNSPNIFYTGSYTESLVVPAPASGSSSTVTYQANGDHGAGLPKFTSLNVADVRPAACDTISAPQASCTTSSAVYTITGLYPIFYGAIDNPTNTATVDNASIAADIAAGGSSGRTSTKLPLVSATGTITIPFTANLNQKTFWIAVPNTGNTAKTKFKPLWGLQIENTFGPSNAWDDYGTVNVNSPTGLWNGISYRIYRSNYSTATGNPGNFQIY